MSAVLRKNAKARERGNYVSLIEAVNSVKIGIGTERQRNPRVDRSKHLRSCLGTVLLNVFSHSVFLTGPYCTLNCSPGFRTKVGKRC